MQSERSLLRLIDAVIAKHKVEEALQMASRQDREAIISAFWVSTPSRSH